MEKNIITNTSEEGTITYIPVPLWDEPVSIENRTPPTPVIIDMSEEPDSTKTLYEELKGSYKLVNSPQPLHWRNLEK